MPEDNGLNSKDLQKASLPLLATRSGIGGVLMGLANLVPGISGGTMLLAAGVYPNFINAIAEVTTFRFKVRPIVVLGCVVAAAALAILLWAGPIKDLVVNQRWIMYSLFIGLTLGGVPIVWRMVGRPNKSMWIGTVCGLLVMSALFVMQLTGFATQAEGKAQYVMFFIAGVAGASAILAKSVSRIFFRNAINQGLPILICDTDRIDDGDELEVDLNAGTIKDLTNTIQLAFDSIPEVMLNILNESGLVPYIMKYGDFKL